MLSIKCMGRQITTISVSIETKAKLDSILYSGGKKQSYEELILELIKLKEKR